MTNLGPCSINQAHPWCSKLGTGTYQLQRVILNVWIQLDQAMQLVGRMVSCSFLEAILGLPWLVWCRGEQSKDNHCCIKKSMNMQLYHANHGHC